MIDSSAWIHWIRSNGEQAVKDRVVALLQSGESCWCPVVCLELWNGAGGSHEQKILRDLEKVLPSLPVTDAVWDAASDLAKKSRARGVTVPTTDLLIFACAQHHGVGLLHTDADFDRLKALTP